MTRFVRRLLCRHQWVRTYDPVTSLRNVWARALGLRWINPNMLECVKCGKRKEGE